MVPSVPASQLLGLQAETVDLLADDDMDLLNPRGGSMISMGSVSMRKSYTVPKQPTNKILRTTSIHEQIVEESPEHHLEDDKVDSDNSLEHECALNYV